MPLATWTDKQIEELKRSFSTTDTRKLAERFGKSYTAVKCKATILGLKKEIHSGSPWTKKNISILVSLYPNTTNKTIAEKLGVNETAVISKAFMLKLKKTKEFMLYCSSKSAFPKGHVPFNKDRSQREYMSPEAIEKTKATRFKKGEVAPNKAHYKDGDITIRYSKKAKRSYKWIRVSVTKWEMLHVVNWEALHGPVPAGHIIVFKDKDTMNCDPNNLEMISLEENMRRNTIHNYPPEIKTTIRLLSKVNKKIRNAKKQDQ